MRKFCLICFSIILSSCATGEVSPSISDTCIVDYLEPVDISPTKKDILNWSAYCLESLGDSYYLFGSSYFVFKYKIESFVPKVGTNYYFESRVSKEIYYYEKHPQSLSIDSNLHIFEDVTDIRPNDTNRVTIGYWTDTFDCMPTIDNCGYTHEHKTLMGSYFNVYQFDVPSDISFDNYFNNQGTVFENNHFVDKYNKASFLSNVESTYIDLGSINSSCVLYLDEILRLEFL